MSVVQPDTLSTVVSSPRGDLRKIARPVVLSFRRANRRRAAPKVRKRPRSACILLPSRPRLRQRFGSLPWSGSPFAAGPEIDYLPVIVTLFFMMFFTLFLLTASYSVKDPRWPSRTMRLREFLRSKVAIGSSTMSGRDVLIETALIPVALAFAATLIGLAWVIFG